MKMTREAVRRLLEAHGLMTDTITGYNEVGEPVPFTSFDATMKIKPEYDKREVYAWLGY